MERIRRTNFSSWAVLGWGLIVLFPLLSACGEKSGSSPQGVTISPTQESIQRDFVNVSCLSCHTQATPKNRYVNLNDIMALTKPVDHTIDPEHHHRVLILPGCPKQSLFLSILKEGKMPPAPSDPISAATIQALESWIVSLKPNAGTSCNSDEPVDTNPGPDEP